MFKGRHAYNNHIRKCFSLKMVFKKNWGLERPFYIGKTLILTYGKWVFQAFQHTLGKVLFATDSIKVQFNGKIAEDIFQPFSRLKKKDYSEISNKFR